LKLLIIDPFGLSLDIAWRAKQHGHEVKMVIRDTPKSNMIGKGMVDVVRDGSMYYRWADLIFLADNSRWLREIDALRAGGAEKIIGPTQELAAWELDRQVGQDILKKHGIATIPSVTFNSYDKAIAFVKKNPRRWVSKPNGDADKALSYCSTSAADMVYMLEKWKRLGKQYEFLLQEFISGIEMGVGGWFGPNGWATPFEENFEFKKLMDGDKGVATGEQGTVLRCVSKSKLARKVLVPLTDTLADKKFVGNIDVNCIIDATGNVWPLEFTVRAGWPAFNIEQELHGISDPVEWLAMVATGEEPPVIEDKIAIGVCLTIPDYPYSHLTRKEVVGAPIYGLTDRLMPHVHFGEVMWGKAPCGENCETTPMPVTAGDYVLVMSATGDTVYEAKQTAYRRLKRVNLPNSPMYRTDIGDRLAKQLPQLQEHGFATGVVFSPTE